MLTDSMGATTAAPRNSLPTSERPVVRLAVMRELEASLLGSRKAVLSLDLDGIERETREQMVLVAKLAALSPLEALTPANAVYQQLRQCELRTLQAGRVQAALLARLRSKLRVLANVLAGPGVNYGLIAGTDREPPRVIGGAEAGKS